MPKLKVDYPGQRKRRFVYLRSFLPVLVLLLLFSFSLASYSLLSRFRSPAAKQQIGWQSWDFIEITAAKGDTEDIEGGSNGTEHFQPSIPIDVWDPLSPHNTGLTEIAIKPCYFPPYLFPSYCAPVTTPELDKTKGTWVVVEKDLNIRSGLWYLNVYYRRTRRLDTQIISAIRVLPDPVPETLKSDLEGWIKADGDLHSGVWPKQDPKRLWYKLRDQDWNSNDAVDRRQEIASDYGEVITELDIVYGDDEPFFGFERVEGGKVLEAKEGKWESVDIAFRRGNPAVPKATTPTFHSDGTFKIMQIADLHYSVGSGECRDTDKSPCSGDPDTATWLADALEAEKPDLVVFSGDQLNGQGTSYDSRSVLAKFARPVIEKQIPWCAVFGNHDSEIAEDREYQMRTLQNMPYSLAQAGPRSVDGVGNYIIQLHSSDPSHVHLFTLYFLDSHDYQGRTLPWVKPDYDYIKNSQIDWYLNVSSSIKAIERPFQPDGTEDLGHIWRRRSQPSRLPSRADTQLAKPNAMMWFHIPLPEAYSSADTSSLSGEALELGDQFDGSGASKHNSGFFYNAIKASFEAGASGEEDWMFSQPKTTEVKVLSHGHCHNTDRCRRVDGVWTCFDGGSSYSGYGQLDFDRRVRVYQISDYGEKIETYKRLTTGENIDQQILIGDGAADKVGQNQMV